ncbi:3-deoxy-D-manno-octulosonate 8-phosphate phosphatase KdsC [Aquicella siphonis]|uniref:3-deoxy-D-manno-octulosonate 8-phosphate phosphatase KdsC n=1 Tax=Aquicella siphonis TaxID=254247 RepID=A0A5E4PID9_9COXI|nr:HAD-IIIA family hydrolase [Aquicella siphonis]VVC76121.1 3-deoxy-D-manno-octulosonate 8-phosphate phosphatase KdsC [Aquicella siphonis]
MQSLKEKAKSIRLFILDVDGILTTGAIYHGSNGFEMRGFHIHDGLGIKLLQKAGITVAVISGKKSEPVEKRMRELNIQHAYLGHENKLPAYEELKQQLQLKDHEIAYMGDDLPDLPLLKRAGLSITVPGTPEVISQAVDFITKKKPGKGAVREVCDWLLEAQDRYQSVIQSYLV